MFSESINYTKYLVGSLVFFNVFETAEWLQIWGQEIVRMIFTAESECSSVSVL